MPRAKKKSSEKPVQKTLKFKGFELTGEVVSLNGKSVGDYTGGEFIPSTHGESLGFVWMQASKGRDMLTYLVRQQDAIQNPPKKYFKKKGE